MCVRREEEIGRRHKEIEECNQRIVLANATKNLGEVVGKVSAEMKDLKSEIEGGREGGGGRIVARFAASR